MKAVVQRVLSSGVSVDGEVIGSIGKGYTVLVGVDTEDTEEQAELLAAKIANLRVFEDANGKMNQSVLDIGGEILVISQFTLCADIKKGNRPSFTLAAEPHKANALYEYFMECLRLKGINVQHGMFGADMKVSIMNDGPVTIVMDTEIWRKK